MHDEGHAKVLEAAGSDPALSIEQLDIYDGHIGSVVVQPASCCPFGAGAGNFESSCR